MADVAESLLGRAFEQVPGTEANAAIARIREQHGSELGQALSYELVLPEGDVTEHLKATVLPRLVYFLDSCGAKLPQVQGVVVSIFRGDRLYFVHAADVIDELAKLSGLTPQQMVEKYGAASV